MTGKRKGQEPAQPDLTMHLFIAPFDHDVGGLDKMPSEYYGPAVGAFEERYYLNGQLEIPAKADYLKVRIYIYREGYGFLNQTYENVWGLEEDGKSISFFYSPDGKKVIWHRYVVTHEEAEFSFHKWSNTDDPEVLQCEAWSEIREELAKCAEGISITATGCIGTRKKEELELVFGAGPIPEEKPGWKVYDLPYGHIRMWQGGRSSVADTDEMIVRRIVCRIEEFRRVVIQCMERARLTDPEFVEGEIRRWMRMMYEEASRFESII